MDEHSLQFWSQKISKAHMEQCKPIACDLTQNKTRCVWSLHFSDLEAEEHFHQSQNSSRQRRSFRKQEGLRRYQNWTGLISPPKHGASTIWKLVLDKKSLFQGKPKRLDGSYGPLWVLKKNYSFSWIAGSWFGMKSLKGGCMFRKTQWHWETNTFSARVGTLSRACSLLCSGFWSAMVYQHRCSMNLILLDRIFGVTEYSTWGQAFLWSQKISWINWKSSLEHYKKH